MNDGDKLEEQFFVKYGMLCPLSELTKPISKYFGPSGVRALPLAAGRNEGGHYFRYFSSLLFFFYSPLLFKTPEGVVIGFQIFAWAPN